MSIKKITIAQGWVRLVDDVADKLGRTVQCRGEDPVEVAVFKDTVTPGDADAGLVLYPKRFMSKEYDQTQEDTIRAVPSSDEAIYGRAYLNKPAEIGVMI